VKQAESARGCAGSGASKWCGPPPPPRAGCGFGFLAGARGYAGVVASAGLRVPAQDLTRPLGQDLQASISIRDLHNSYSLLIVIGVDFLNFICLIYFLKKILYILL
jgi:hypothetical protein